MLQTLPLFLFAFGLSISGSFEAQPEVIFSSNVTSLQIGASAKLTCELKNFSPGNALYEVFFLREEGGSFGHYHISAPDSTGKRQTTFNNETSYQPSLGRHPLSSSFSVFEITFTPTIAVKGEFYCNLDNGTVDIDSKNVSITATPPQHI